MLTAVDATTAILTAKMELSIIIVPAYVTVNGHSMEPEAAQFATLQLPVQLTVEEEEMSVPLTAEPVSTVKTVEMEPTTPLVDAFVTLLGPTTQAPRLAALALMEDLIALDTEMSTPIVPLALVM